MLKPTLASTLLSLFIDPTRADEIEGDLLEEKQLLGNFWFVRHILQTTFLQYKAALMSSPVSILLASALLAEIAMLGCWWSMSFFQYPNPRLPLNPYVMITLVHGALGILISWSLPRRGNLLACTTALLSLLIWSGLPIIAVLEVLQQRQQETDKLLAAAGALPLVFVMTGITMFAGSVLVAHTRNRDRYRRQVLRNYGAG